MLGLISAGLGAASFIGDALNRREARRQAEAQAQAQRQAMAQAQQYYSPYLEAGQQALQQQQALSGALGAEAQQAAISEIESSPQLQAMMEQGEAGMLANAAATGGLRGGNLQGALAQYRPQMLNQAIQQQYQQLGGLTNMGYGAAGALSNVAQGGVPAAGLEAQANAPWLGQSLLTGIGSGIGAYTGLGGTFGQAPAASTFTPMDVTGGWRG